MKKLFIFILCLQIAVPAFAQPSTVLVRSVDATDYELKQFVQVYRSNRTYSDYLIERRQSAPERKILLNRFEKAQRDFLNSSYKVAKTAFAAVVSMAHNGPWLPKDREIIFSSYMRLAQLSPKESQHWLELAARFALDLNPSDEKFPPPLIAQAAQIRSTVLDNVVLWQPPFWDSVDSIIVDGKMYRSEGRPSIPLTEGTHRIDIYSNISPPDSRMLSREQMLAYSFPLNPIAGGDCNSPALSSKDSPKARHVGIFYSINCSRKFEDGAWSDLIASGKIDLTPAPPQNALAAPPASIEPEKKSKSWIWWLVAGAAVSGTYLIYEQNRHEDSRIQPTHETGLR